MQKNIRCSAFIQLVKNNAVFITLSLILFGVLGLAILCIPKGELHLLLCDHHTYARDIFYRYYTKIAEYLPYLVCIFVFLFGRAGDAAMSAGCLAGAELTTQIIKHIVNAPRPLTWFAANMPEIQLPVVEGVKMHHWFSFPSGHTTTFFALAFVLSILATEKIKQANPNVQPDGEGQASKRLNRILVCSLLQAVLFVLAALGAYSRIYLSQHFALDVFAGMGVGLTFTCLIYALFSHWKSEKWYNFRVFSKK